MVVEETELRQTEAHAMKMIKNSGLSSQASERNLRSEDSRDDPVSASRSTTISGEFRDKPIKGSHSRPSAMRSKERDTKNMSLEPPLSSTDENDFHDAIAFPRFDDESTIDCSQFEDASDHTRIFQGSAVSCSNYKPERRTPSLNSSHFRRDDKNEDILDFVFEKIERMACTMDDEPETIKDILDEVFEYLEDVACGEIAQERNSAIKESFERFLVGIDHLASLVPQDESTKNKGGENKDLLDIVCQHLEKCKTSRVSAFFLGHFFDKDLIDDVFAHIETGGGCKKRKKKSSNLKKKVDKGHPPGQPLGNLLSSSEESNDELDSINQSLFNIIEEGSQCSEPAQGADNSTSEARKENHRLLEKEKSRHSNLRKLRGNIHGNVKPQDVFDKASECHSIVQEHILRVRVQLEAFIEGLEIEKLWELMVLGAVHDDNDDVAIADLESLSLGQSHGFISPAQSDVDNIVVYRSSFETTSVSSTAPEGRCDDIRALSVVEEQPEEGDPDTAQAEHGEDARAQCPTPPSNELFRWPNNEMLTKEKANKNMRQYGRTTPDSAVTEQTCDETLSFNSGGESDEAPNMTKSSSSGPYDYNNLVSVAFDGMAKGHFNDRARRFNRTLSLDGVSKSGSSDSGQSIGASSLGPYGRRTTIFPRGQCKSIDAPGTLTFLKQHSNVAERKEGSKEMLNNHIDCAIELRASFEPEVDADVVAQFEAELDAIESIEKQTMPPPECVKLSIEEKLSHLSQHSTLQSNEYDLASLQGQPNVSPPSNTSPISSTERSDVNDHPEDELLPTNITKSKSENLDSLTASDNAKASSMMSFFSDMDPFQSPTSADSFEVPHIPTIMTCESLIDGDEGDPQEVELSIVEESEKVASHSRRNEEILVVEDGTKSAKILKDHARLDLSSSRAKDKHSLEESCDKDESSLAIASSSNTLFDAIGYWFNNKNTEITTDWYDKNFGTVVKVIMLVIYVGIKVAATANMSLMAHFEERKQRLKAKMLERSCEDAATSTIISSRM